MHLLGKTYRKTSKGTRQTWNVKYLAVIKSTASCQVLLKKLFIGQYVKDRETTKAISNLQKILFSAHSTSPKMAAELRNNGKYIICTTLRKQKRKTSLPRKNYARKSSFQNDAGNFQEINDTFSNSHAMDHSRILMISEFGGIMEKQKINYLYQPQPHAMPIMFDSAFRSSGQWNTKHSKLPIRCSSPEKILKKSTRKTSIIGRLSETGQHATSKIPISRHVIDNVKASAAVKPQGKKSPPESPKHKQRLTKSASKPNESVLKRDGFRSRSPKDMGNKPTRVKDKKSHDESRPEKSSSKKKAKTEGQSRSETKWKPGRGKKAHKQGKTPVAADPSSGHTSPADHLTTSDTLFRSTVLSLLPNGETYNDDQAVIEAFEKLVHHWKKEYDDKCLALEALAVTIKHQLAEQGASTDSHKKTISDLKEEQLAREKHLLKLLTDENRTEEESSDDDEGDLESQILQLQDERNHLQAELEKLRTSVASSPPQSPASDSVSPASCTKCKDVSAEIESLQIVLDMKKKEVQRLNVDRMKLLQKFEKYYELEKKFDVLSHEREAMSMVLESKAKFERQLSVERDSLAVDLEKQSRKIAQLSMEKEELLWRASNGSFSSSTPDLNNLDSFPVNGFRSSTPTINNNPVKPLSSTHCSFTIHET